MKKIAIIAHGLSDGGAERVASIIANALVQRGGVELLYISAISGEKVYALDDDKIEFFYKDPIVKNTLVRFAIRNYNVYKKIKEFSPDLILSFLTNEALLTGIRIKCRSIYSLRNDPYNNNNTFIKRNIRRVLFKKADRIVFQTQGAKGYFEEVIQSKGVIIDNPIVENLPYWSNFEHEKSIVTACRLEAQKNLPLLLKGFARFHAKHPEYTLKICGNGRLQTVLENLCVTLDIKEAVYFMGFRKDIHKIMANSSIFALTSDYEGVSNSMLEALAIGIPLVCTDSSPGGASEFIKNNTNGILIQPGDVDALFDAFCRISENESYAKMLSANAIEVRKRLDIESVISKWLDLIGGQLE